MTNTLTIRGKYRPLFRPTEQRYILLTGGRNSAKSFTVALAEAFALTKPEPTKTLFTRYTLSSAEISIIPEFQDKLSLAGLERKFDQAKNVITHKDTGNSIIFAGIKTSSGNQTAKLKSIPGLSRFVVDEAEEFRDEVAFDTIDFSVRSIDSPNRVTLIMNPQDTDHFIWRKWFDGYTEYVTIDGAQIPMSTHPEVLHIHSTYLNNLDNIPKGYFEKIMHLRLTNRAKYEHLFLGKWREQAEGAVFPNWIEGPFDMSLPYAYGLDYGYFPDPLALVRVAVDTAARRIYLHEEIYATELSTDNTVKQVLSIAGRERMVIADTSEPRLTAGIAAAGVNIQKADKSPDSVINGLKDMQDYQIVVTPESHNLKRELNTYVWNDKKSSTPVDANNHALDATRYCYTRLAEGSDVSAWA
jgi:phage terminase large subunit